MQMWFHRKTNPDSWRIRRARYEKRFATICNQLLRLAGNGDEELRAQTTLELTLFRLELVECRLELLKAMRKSPTVFRLPPIPTKEEGNEENLISIFQKLDRCYRECFSEIDTGKGG